jgi:hypothetical protein
MFIAAYWAGWGEQAMRELLRQYVVLPLPPVDGRQYRMARERPDELAMWN